MIVSFLGIPPFPPKYAWGADLSQIAGTLYLGIRRGRGAVSADGRVSSVPRPG